MYKSTNNGTTWIQTSLNQLVRPLALSGNNIFARAVFNGVYISNDNVATWKQRNEGLGNVTVSALSILNNFLFASTHFVGAYRRPLGELIGIEPISQ